jgi:hypothetical protein
MSDEVEEFVPWTKAGADRLRAAATALKDAIAAHADAVASAGEDINLVFQASDRLVPAVLGYADAQFAYTGNGYPFGALHRHVDDDDEDEDEHEDEGPTSGISIVQRHDYVVTDADAVMEAGRRAYLRVWPDDTEAAASADVNHLGSALYQLAHADGWDNLRGVDGLAPVAGFVAVVKQEELLGPDPDDWSDGLVEEDAQVLFSQADIFRPR